MAAPEKHTDFLSRIDFGNPALAPVLRMITGTLRREADAFRPRAGLRVVRGETGGVPCAVIEPETDEALPGILYCHGGGFFLPVQCSALRLAEEYAAALPARVFLPEYRLLPEHPAPAALDDCLAVRRAMRDHSAQLRLDGRVLLCGESAGGALAAGVALCAKDENGPPDAGQILLYPALDDRAQPYPSRAGVEGAVWNVASNAAMWRQYLRESGAQPRLVPLRAEDLSGLPGAYVEAAQADILRDEAAAYVRALAHAGVRAELRVIPGAVHGFDADADDPFVRSALDRRIAAMRDLLASHHREKETGV